MKKLLSAALLLSSLMGSAAMAMQTMYMKGLDNCPPVPTHGSPEYCPQVEEPYCPNHSTRPEPRYCKSNGSWVQCGWVCVFDPFSGGT